MFANIRTNIESKEKKQKSDMSVCVSGKHSILNRQAYRCSLLIQPTAVGIKNNSLAIIGDSLEMSYEF